MWAAGSLLANGIEPVQIPTRYEPGPEDVARLDRVHTMILGTPEAFRKAGAQLDARYSVDACLERDLEGVPFTEERGQKTREYWTRKADAVARLRPRLVGERAIALANHRESEFRHTVVAFTPPTREDWETPSKRFSLAVASFENEELAISVPHPGWDWAAKILLFYFLICDPRSDDEPVLTAFQGWKWEGEDDFGGRAMAQYMVQDDCWPRFIKAVEHAIALAAQLGMAVGPSASHHEKPTGSEPLPSFTPGNVRAVIVFPRGKKGSVRQTVVVERFHSGQETGRATISGEAHVVLLRVVRALSWHWNGERLVPWDVIEPLFHKYFTYAKQARQIEKARKRGKEAALQERIPTRQTLVTYAQRIRRDLKRGGIESLWDHSPGAGARFRA